MYHWQILQFSTEFKALAQYGNCEIFNFSSYSSAPVSEVKVEERLWFCVLNGLVSTQSPKAFSRLDRYFSFNSLSKVNKNKTWE